jgi:hypothetical protein
MSDLNVVEELDHFFLLSCLLENVPDAGLSEVLHHNLRTPFVVHRLLVAESAVLSVVDTVVILPLLFTGLARPGDSLGLEVDLVNDWPDQALHVLNEHQTASVRRRVPKCEVGLVLRLWLHEVDVDVNLSSVLKGGTFDVIDELGTLFFADHHRWNPDSCT